MQETAKNKVAVLIPCYNEEKTLRKVIQDFRRELPESVIYVFDNNSTDRSVAIAKENGAVIILEPRQGKGFVVERMFSAIDADLYIMVDGDDTYPAECIHSLMEPVKQGLADMTVGRRNAQFEEASFRKFHLFGNRMVRCCINWIMGSDLKDILSGYRVFNRAIIERIPVISSGFEIETELTIQTLYYQRKIIEIDIPYRARPEGSVSKLHTISDGFRVVWKLFSLFRSLKPLTFFGGIGGILFILGLVAGWLPVRDYLVNPNHYVAHVPSAILAAGLMMLAFLFMFIGLLLHAVNKRFLEIHNVLTRLHPKEN
ncbi:MAG: glycosyltransferase family 2 protein [Anaerohalosphaeraceae bacterium]